jgi:hypothetical protein
MSSNSPEGGLGSYKLFLPFTAFLFGLYSTIAIAQLKSPPAHLDPENRTLWSDAELGVRFSYPSVWHEGLRTQESTEVTITWRLTTSKSLLATCYIETLGWPHSSIAGIGPSEFHESGQSIAESFAKNLRQRAPDARLLSWRNAYQDGQAVVHIVRQGTVEAIDRRIRMKIYSIVTSWRGRELNLECATSVFGPEYTQLKRGSQLVDQVERGIFNVLRTLQFDR